MRKPILLNDLYAQYAAGLLEKKEVETGIFEMITKTPRRFNLHRWQKDEYGDFLSWLYPRISKSIDTYHVTGASFNAYIYSMINWAVKEYRSLQMEQQIAEYATLTAGCSDQYVYEDEPEYIEVEEQEPQAEVKRVANPRQLLMLVLKYYGFVSDDFLDRIAPCLGEGKERLKKMVDKLRVWGLNRDSKKRQMQERIYSQYYRCIKCEKKMKTLNKDSPLWGQTETQLKKAETRLAALRKQFSGIRTEATNAQIANILGVSKGTVDSSLFAVKRQLNIDPKKFILS